MFNFTDATTYLIATSIAPTAIRPIPRTLLSDNFSLKNITPKIAINTMLNLDEFLVFM